MVGTILPVGYREKGTLFWYSAGCLLGATACGAVLGFGGRLILGYLLALGSTHLYIMISLVSLAFGAHELGLVRFPVPQFRYQVPRGWRRFPDTFMGLSYGLVLGFGVFTRLPVSTFHLAALCAFCTCNPYTGAFIMTGFGLGRILPLVSIRTRSTHAHMFKAYEEWRGAWPLVRPINGIVLWLAAASFLALAVLAKT